MFLFRHQTGHIGGRGYPYVFFEVRVLYGTQGLFELKGPLKGIHSCYPHIFHNHRRPSDDHNPYLPIVFFFPPEEFNVAVARPSVAWFSFMSVFLPPSFIPDDFLVTRRLRLHHSNAGDVKVTAPPPSACCATHQAVPAAVKA